MAESRERLERAADRYREPATGPGDIRRRAAERSRRKRVASTVVGLVLTALIVIPLVRLGIGGDPGPSPQSTVGDEPWRTVFSDDFSEGGSPRPSGEPLSLWPTFNRPSVSMGYVDGAYEITVSRTFDWRYWVVGGSDAVDDVRVRATIGPSGGGRTDTANIGPALSGLQGVMCVSELDPVDAYVFAVNPLDRFWTIQRIEDRGTPERLARGPISAGDPLEPQEVIGRCTLTDGVARLSLTFGGETFSVDDPDPHGPFRGIGMYLASTGSTVAARYDDLALEVPASGSP
jgi:hypothetical protein